jgi:hypothetical protein
MAASTFFDFALRRFVELQDVHRKLAVGHPPNYGTLTAMILHLMRTIMVNSSNIPSYVQSTLNTLHQRAVMERFGMFFIDDLDPDDMERIIINLGEKDHSDIVREHKNALATKPATQKVKARGIQLVASYLTTEYPWGETITWSMLQKLCKLHPVDFFRKFEFETIHLRHSSQEILESTVDLFVSFTKDAWLSLHEAFLPAGIRPNPTSLKEAMEVWACQRIMALLGGRSTFLPSTYELEGAPKKKNSDISFLELRSLFFPSSTKIFKSNTIWTGYMSSGGYIRKYWDFLEEKKDEPLILDGVNETLDEIFSELQCLPQSTADSTIWHATDGLVCFLTNPLYYRIKSVSSTGPKTQIVGPQRPQVSTAELQKRLNPGNPTSRRRKRAIRGTRSSKSKNFRQPPTKRRKLGNRFERGNESSSSSSSPSASSSASASASPSTSRKKKRAIKATRSSKSKKFRQPPTKNQKLDNRFQRRNKNDSSSSSS